MPEIAAQWTMFAVKIQITERKKEKQEKERNSLRPLSSFPPNQPANASFGTLTTHEI